MSDKDLMREYCINDVEVMRAAGRRMRDLTPEEWEEYHLTCRINQRGLPVDVPLCKAAVSRMDRSANEANDVIQKLTGGKMMKHTERKSRDAWLYPKLTPLQIKSITDERTGKRSLDKDRRAILIQTYGIDEDAKELLQAIDDAGSSALKKYAVALHTHIGGRVFNTFQFNGAGTGRFSGRGLQPHNMRRDAYSPEEAEALAQAVIAGEPIENVSNVMARLLRGMLLHEMGIYFVDWSSIEGRVAPWLANSSHGEARLELYRNKMDVYKVTAALMIYKNADYMDRVTPEDRQIGKIAELSLQFGGTKRALQSMAKKFDVHFSDAAAMGHVENWQRTNPWALDSWVAFEEGAKRAVMHPNTDFRVGRCTFRAYQLVEENFSRFLWLQLPSERILAYPMPRYGMVETPWGTSRKASFQTSLTPAKGEPPIRHVLRGSLLFQNATQAVAADCLRESLLCADSEGLDIVGHVHDEIIGLGPREDGERLNNIMLEQPWWADGLPLDTGGVSWGKRYGK